MTDSNLSILISPYLAIGIPLILPAYRVISSERQSIRRQNCVELNNRGRGIETGRNLLVVTLGLLLLSILY